MKASTLGVLKIGLYYIRESMGKHIAIKSGKSIKLIYRGLPISLVKVVTLTSLIMPLEEVNII